MTDPRGIVVPDYASACAAIRARADALNISRAAIDDLADLPEGNAGKLLSPVPDKRMQAETMLRMLDAVELDVVLVPRPGAEQRIADLVGERQKAQVRTGNLRSVLRTKKKAKLERIFTDPNFFKKIGRSGGRARGKSMTRDERRKAAVWANKVRWRKARAQRRATRCAPGAVPIAHQLPA